MRIKARALGIAAEDYFNDKVLEDTELLFSGMERAARRLLGASHGKGMESWQQGGHTYYRLTGPLDAVAPASTSSSTSENAGRRAASTRW